MTDGAEITQWLDAAREGAEERGADQPHEAGEADEADIGGAPQQHSPFGNVPGQRGRAAELLSRLTIAAEPRQLERFRGSVTRVFDQSMDATRLRAFYNPLIGFLPQVGLAAMMLVGGRRRVGRE